MSEAWAGFSEVAYFNPLEPAFRTNPYPQYERLRRLDPVHWSPYAHCWVLTRYEDVRSVLGDKRFGIALDYLQSLEALKATFAEPFNQIIRTQILAADPPDHTRIRKILAKAFGASAVERMRERIQATVDGWIDQIAPRGHMDVMKELAYPLPFKVICDLLDLPLDERAPLEDYTHWLMRTTDPTPMSREELDLANTAAVGFRDYFDRRAQAVRSLPRTTVFQEMVDAMDAGVINAEEFAANMTLLFCAGHDTVVNLFGNGLLALHRNPDQLERLKREPGLMKNAVEELLRYDTSVQIARRTALEDVVVGGKTIPQWSYVLCSLGAASRDPAAYPDPDRLDVARHDAKAMSFGGGIHYCLGAQLARLEGEVVFSTILRRLPDLRLDTLDPPWHQNVFVRGLESLPASW